MWSVRLGQTIDGRSSVISLDHSQADCQPLSKASLRTGYRVLFSPLRHNIRTHHTVMRKVRYTFIPFYGEDEPSYENNVFCWVLSSLVIEETSDSGVCPSLAESTRCSMRTRREHGVFIWLLTSIQSVSKKVSYRVLLDEGCLPSSCRSCCRLYRDVRMMKRVVVLRDGREEEGKVNVKKQ